MMTLQERKTKWFEEKSAAVEQLKNHIADSNAAGISSVYSYLRELDRTYSYLIAEETAPATMTLKTQVASSSTYENSFI